MHPRTLDHTICGEQSVLRAFFDMTEYVFVTSYVCEEYELVLSVSVFATCQRRKV